jgi:hypothetical protein
MGKTVEEPRKVKVSVRLTAEEAAGLARVAKRSRMTLPELLRLRILGRAGCG